MIQRVSVVVPAGDLIDILYPGRQTRPVFAEHGHAVLYSIYDLPALVRVPSRH